MHAMPSKYFSGGLGNKESLAYVQEDPDYKKTSDFSGYINS